MKQNSTIHHRKSISLKEYDYSQAGDYFVTLCTNEKVSVFGEVVEDEVRLSPIGAIAKKCWNEIPKHFPMAELDAFVVMPNHIHGIIVLNDYGTDVQLNGMNKTVGVENIQPLPTTFQHVTSKSLGSIVRSYKAAVSRECRKRNIYDFSWQRNYYDHIIRDGKDLDRICEYIIDNPIKWYLDENNTNRPAE